MQTAIEVIVEGVDPQTLVGWRAATFRAYPKRGLTLSGEVVKPMKLTRPQRVRPHFG